MNPKKFAYILAPAAILIGTTLFLIVTLALGVDFNAFTMTYDESIDSPLLIPFMAVFALCFILSFIVPGKLPKNDGEDEYQQNIKVIITKYALLEGPALFGIVMMLTTYLDKKAVAFSPVCLGLLAYIFLALTFLTDVPKLIKMVMEDTENFEE